MAMKRLWCVWIDKGYGFELDASADASVVKLKELVKATTRVSCPAASISLYTTKGGNWGGWLQTTSEEYELLKQLKVPGSVNEMLIPENELDPLSFVGDDAYGFPNKYENGDHDIHLLVKLPENWSREQEAWDKALAYWADTGRWLLRGGPYFDLVSECSQRKDKKHE